MKKIYILLLGLLTMCLVANAENGIKLTFSRTDANTAPTIDSNTKAVSGITVTVTDLNGNTINNVTAELATVSFPAFWTNGVCAANTILGPSNASGDGAYSNKKGATATFTFKISELSNQISSFDKIKVGIEALGQNGGVAYYQWKMSDKTFDLNVKTGSSTDNLSDFASLSNVYLANNDGANTQAQSSTQKNYSNQVFSGSSEVAVSSENDLYLQVTVTKTVDGGCFFGLEDIEIVAPTQNFTVTYNVTYTAGSSNTRSVSTTQECEEGTTPTFTVPANYTIEYNGTKYNAGEVISFSDVSSTQSIALTANYVPPFTISKDYDNATWYYIKSYNVNQYLHYDGNNEAKIPMSSSKRSTQDYKWAFIGSVADGFKIINKAKASSYLYDASPKGGDEITYPHMADSSTTWMIFPANIRNATWNNKPSDLSNLFSFYPSGFTTTYWNVRDGAFSYWSGGFDNGSCWLVEEATDADIADYSALKTALEKAKTYNIGPNLDQYDDTNNSLSDVINNAQELADGESTNTDVSYTQQKKIDEATSALNTALSKLSLNMPKVGTYLTITPKAYSSTTLSLSNATAGNTTLSVATSPTSGTNIWYYGEKGLVNYAGGTYLNAADRNASVSNVAVEFSAGTSDDQKGYYLIKTGDNYLNVNWQGIIGTGTTTSTYQMWAFRLAKQESLPVKMTKASGNGYYYASLCLPTAITLPTDGKTKAYYIKKADNTSMYATLTEIPDNVIHDSTPVILVNYETGDDNTKEINVTVSDDRGTDISEDNALAGVLTATNFSLDNYYLGISGGKAGLYRVTDNSTSYFLTNKAYLQGSTTSGSKGFAFAFDDDDPTGINGASAENGGGLDVNAPMYNLQGVRVPTWYKGIVVQNGQKYLLK